ncbi:hypothetical protein C0989_002383 [Termitomyces sp. Mn162]|nr:hypothetical protein C0989_002383 [Termitomyces sp. Mn162]
MMLDELLRDEKTTPTRMRPKRPPRPRPRIIRPLLTSPNHAFQRRHASFATESESTSETALPDISAFSRIERRIQRFQRIAQLPLAEVNLHHLWRTYESVKNYDMSLPSKMNFLDKYLSAAEMQYQSKSENLMDELNVPAENALGILDDLKQAITPGSRFDHWRLCLLARAYALRGDLEAATDVICEADDKFVALPLAFKTGTAYAYNMILTSIRRYSGNVRAMEYIGDHWERLYFYLYIKMTGHDKHPQRNAGESLRATATRVAAEITEPLPFLQKKNWNRKRREDIGCFFIQALSDVHFGTEAHEVLLEMQQLDLNVDRKYKFMIIRSLAQRTPTMSSAIALYKSIPPNSEHDLFYYQLGLHLYARQGDVEAFQGCFDKICAVAEPSADEIASLIHGHGMAGNAEAAEDVFKGFFPVDENGNRMNSPRITHYAAVINAHARKGADQKALSFWLNDLSKAGLAPNEFIFTSIINAFATVGDFESAMAVLDQMRRAGVRPNAVTYTIVITLLAHRQDPMGAEAVFKRALKEGVVPDNRMIVSVMNAHVEGGSWMGVIRAYDYLIAARVTALSLEVYNTLMKAYVLIGAPFSVVYKFFKRLERTKAKPDSYTYSLLVQSACDAGLMDIAADIYYDMKERASYELNADVNVYILTILMAGFLQHGDTIRAQGVHREMQELGINPSPITYRTILQAYANERSKESLEIAERYIKTLIDVPEKERTWKRPKYDSSSALQHLYGPVMHGWSRMKSPEDVERVLQELQNSGETPTLGNLTALLDVYRLTFNIDAVREIWPDILKLGLKFTAKDWMAPEDNPLQTTRGVRGNVLCVPLSIYIDALSCAGEHTTIASVWKDLRGQGFSFDSHNWNHLAVAMVRAGQVERAFEVIERVIIPYQELSINSRKPRDRSPSSPLLSDALAEKQEEDEEEEDVPSVPAVRSVHRQIAAKLSSARTRDMEDFQREADHSDDFAYHLHILHQISPSWALWKAHKATISVLLMALNSLHQGRLVRPVNTDEEYDDEDDSSQARDMLNRIYNNYPKTLQLVLELDEKERERLSSDEYREQYNLE